MLTFYSGTPSGFMSTCYSKMFAGCSTPPSGSTTRKILNALLKEQVLNYESLVTLMCEVESIINGRPITKVSQDPRDLEALAPNHLLLLRSGSALPPESSERRIPFLARDGDKCSISRINFGDGSHVSKSLCYSTGRSGTFAQKLSCW